MFAGHEHAFQVHRHQRVPSFHRQLCGFPVTFRPAFSKHTGEVCRGVQLHVQYEEIFEPVRAGFEALAIVRRLSADFEWRASHEGIHNFDKLAGTDRIRQAIDDGVDVADLVEEWNRQRQPFAQIRERYLHYT